MKLCVFQSFESSIAWFFFSLSISLSPSLSHSHFLPLYGRKFGFVPDQFNSHYVNANSFGIIFMFARCLCVTRLLLSWWLPLFFFVFIFFFSFSSLYMFHILWLFCCSVLLFKASLFLFGDSIVYPKSFDWFQNVYNVRITATHSKNKWSVKVFSCWKKCPTKEKEEEEV